MCAEGKKTAGNQDNHQNFDPTLLAKKTLTCLHENKANSFLFFFEKNKKTKWTTKKSLFSKTANSQNFYYLKDLTFYKKKNLYYKESEVKLFTMKITSKFNWLKYSTVKLCTDKSNK